MYLLLYSKVYIKYTVEKPIGGNNGMEVTVLGNETRGILMVALLDKVSFFYHFSTLVHTPKKAKQNFLSSRF